MTAATGSNRVGSCFLIIFQCLLALTPALFTHLNLDTSMHPLREWEYEAVFTTYQETGLLVARPGPLLNMTDPFEIPTQDVASNASYFVQGGVGDDVGGYLLASLVGKVFNIDTAGSSLLLIHSFLVFIFCFVLCRTIMRLFSRLWLPAYIVFVGPLCLLFGINSAPGSLAGLEHDGVSATLPYGAATISLSIAAVVFIDHIYRQTPQVDRRLKRQLKSGLKLFCRIFPWLFLATLFRYSAVYFGAVLFVWLVFTLNDQTRKSLLSSFISLCLVLIVCMQAFGFVTTGLENLRQNDEQYRVETTISRHGTWGPLYVGLGWAGDETGLKESAAGVVWSDRWALDRVLSELRSDDVLDDRIEGTFRSLYFDTIWNKKIPTIRIYLEKLLYSLSWMLPLFAWLMLWFYFVSSISDGRRLRRRKRFFPSFVRSASFSTAFLFALTELVLVAPFPFYGQMAYAFVMLAAITFMFDLILGKETKDNCGVQAFNTDCPVQC